MTCRVLTDLQYTRYITNDAIDCAKFWFFLFAWPYAIKWSECNYKKELLFLWVLYKANWVGVYNVIYDMFPLYQTGFCDLVKTNRYNGNIIQQTTLYNATFFH